MPIYEYDCGDCRRRVSLLVLKPSATEPPRCPRCGGTALTRLMSRFATIKSEESRLESLGDPGNFGDVDENDPTSVARFMKKMGQEFGEDLGDDFDEAIDEAMADPEGEGEAAGTDTGDSTASDDP